MDIPERDRGALDALARKLGISRAELVRRAIELYLRQKCNGREEAFGLWQDRAEDGVAYQDRLRREWQDDR